MPLPPIVSPSFQQSRMCCKVSIQTVDKFEKEKGFKRMLPTCSLLSCCAVGGQREEVAGLAELEADSSGKLWAEVDKDIRVAACIPTDAGWGTGALYDSKYSVFVNV